MQRKNQLETETRRFFQPVWNALDDTLGSGVRKIALCVSGGTDSRALLEAVARWPMRHELAFYVLSVDHCTRAESAMEAKKVVARAKALGFDAQALSLYPLLKSDEATLRSRRYQAIWRFAQMRQIDAICTAHHQDDDAEGFVMDLFGLGGGHEGSAMSPILKTPSGIIFRPLLGFSRKYLLLLLTACGAIDYFSDPTNEMGHGKRSQVRAWLNADSQKFHPNPLKRLAHVARQRGQDLMALYEIADELIAFEESDKVKICLDSSVSDALVLRALSSGLKRLVPDKDLRAASPVLNNLIAKRKKVLSDQREGLDRKAASFTLGAKGVAYFDLPGVLATLTHDCIILQKADKGEAFSVQNDEFC